MVLKWLCIFMYAVYITIIAVNFAFNFDRLWMQLYMIDRTIDRPLILRIVYVARPMLSRESIKRLRPLSLIANDIVSDFWFLQFPTYSKLEDTDCLKDWQWNYNELITVWKLLLFRSPKPIDEEERQTSDLKKWVKSY